MTHLTDINETITKGRDLAAALDEGGAELSGCHCGRPDCPVGRDIVRRTPEGDCADPESLIDPLLALLTVVAVDHKGCV